MRPGAHLDDTKGVLVKELSIDVGVVSHAVARPAVNEEDGGALGGSPGSQPVPRGWPDVSGILLDHSER